MNAVPRGIPAYCAHKERRQHTERGASVIVARRADELTASMTVKLTRNYKTRVVEDGERLGKHDIALVPCERGRNPRYHLSLNGGACPDWASEAIGIVEVAEGDALEQVAGRIEALIEMGRKMTGDPTF